VTPARDLAAWVGEQRTYHSDEPFRFERAYLDELRRLEVASITRPGRYLLIAARGDELLDWRDMVAKYAGAPTVLLEGGDHGLSDFAGLIDRVLAFAGLADPVDRNGPANPDSHSETP